MQHVHKLLENGEWQDRKLSDEIDVNLVSSLSVVYSHMLKTVDYKFTMEDKQLTISTGLTEVVNVGQEGNCPIANLEDAMDVTFGQAPRIVSKLGCDYDWDCDVFIKEPCHCM